VLRADKVGLDRLEGVLLDHIDAHHRRCVDEYIDVDHRIPHARRIADVAGEEPAAVVMEAAPHDRRTHSFDNQ